MNTIINITLLILASLLVLSLFLKMAFSALFIGLLSAVFLKILIDKDFRNLVDKYL